MTDALGWRRKFGVLAPSTNTSVQPEYDGMRPHGVTNHFSRMTIKDMKVTDDKSFMVMMDNIRAALMPALDSVMSCSPDYVVMGMSAETFWDGLEGSAKLQARMEKRAGVGIAMGSDACQAALRRYGRSVKRLGIVTPYMPVGDRQVHRFFTECGFEVVNLKGLKCKGPMLIAHTSEKELRDASHREVGADLHDGVHLALVHLDDRVAAMAEFWLDKPVVAINTATYWWALRQNNIRDKIQGWGSLLSEY